MPEQVAVEETPGPEVEGGRAGVAVGGKRREGGREGGREGKEEGLVRTSAIIIA